MSAPSQRTCIGCRRRDLATALVRLALSEDRERIVIWGPRRLPRPPGRGASLHAEAVCVRAAIGSSAFARAFRGRVGRITEAELLNLIASAVNSVNRKTT